MSDLVVEFVSIESTKSGFQYALLFIGGPISLVLIYVFLSSKEDGVPAADDAWHTTLLARLFIAAAMLTPVAVISHDLSYGRFMVAAVSDLGIHLTYLDLSGTTRTELIRKAEIEEISFTSSGKGPKPSCTVRITTITGRSHVSGGRPMLRRHCEELPSIIERAL